MMNLKGMLLLKENDLKSIEELRNQYLQVIYMLQTKEDLEEALPSPNYYSFMPLIDSIIKKLEEDYLAIEEVCDLDNASDKFEMDLLKMKIEMCITRKNEALNMLKQEEDFQTNLKKKKLIFAKTDSGNLYFDKDLKDISEEYYERVISTLEKIELSIPENNSEKAKQATSVNGKFTNLHYVKEYQIRTFYRVLSDDIAYVMMTRVKKDDNSKLDREEPIKRKKQTEKEFEKYKEMIKDEKMLNEIIEENEKIKNQILEQLSINKRGVK